MRRWLLQEIHISWHISTLSVGCIIGVAIAPRFTHFSIEALPCVLFLCFVIVAGWKGWRLLVLLTLCSGVYFGYYRGVTELRYLHEYVQFQGQIVQLRGRVSEDIVKVHAESRLRLTDVHIASSSFHGEVWVSLAGENQHIKRGDQIIVSGKLTKGFGTLAGAIYRAQLIKTIENGNNDIARKFRDWFNQGVMRTIPEPESLLGIGYITGQQSALPETLNEQLRVVGLTHIVVASGYNLTILVGFTRRFLIAYSKYAATMAAFFMVMGFMLVAGFSPSMVRAGLVTGISLLAWYYGRVVHPFILLPFAAALTVVGNPAYIWGDLGWYLSFSAFAAVIIFAPLLRCYFWGSCKKPSAIVQIMTDTFSAQLLTLPIIIFAFGKLSVYALIANVLVLPLVPLAMFCTFLAGIAGLIVPEIGKWIALPAYTILQYMTWVVDKVASWPGAQKEVQMTATQLILSYISLCILSIFLWRRTKYNFRQDTPEI